MGKNRNRNLLKGRILMNETMLLWVRGVVDTDSRKIAAFITDDVKVQGVLENFFKDTETDHPVELDRGEVGTVCRAILSTSEFSNETTIPTLEGFIGHLYTETLSITQFTTLVDELLGFELTSPITKATSEVIVQYTSVAWVMVRSVLKTILNTIETVNKNTERRVTPEEKKPEPIVENKVDIDVYVMTKDQEKRAKNLGLEVKDHLLNIDAFYQNEMKLIDEWKKSHKGFAPVHEIYGMTMSEYRKWRHDVAVLINEVIAGNEPTVTNPPAVVIDVKPETVASNNIGSKPKKEPVPKLTMDDVIGILSPIMHDPDALMGLRSSLREDKKFNVYMEEMAKERVNTFDPLKMYYRLEATTTDIDCNTLVNMSRDIAKRFNKDEKAVLPYVFLLLVNNDEAVKGALTLVCKDTVIERLMKGQLDNHDLVMRVKAWVSTHTPKPEPGKQYESIIDVIKHVFENSGLKTFA